MSDHELMLALVAAADAAAVAAVDAVDAAADAALAQEARDEPTTDRRYNVAERLFGDD